MNKKRVGFSILGISILIFLIYNIGLSNLIGTLKDFNFIYLPLIIIVLLLSYTLAGINIWILIWPFKKISVLNSIKYVYFTVFFAAMLPGKLADLLLLHFLKKEKLTISQSTIVVFFDKIISLLLKVALGLIGAIFVLKEFNFLFIGIPLITLAIIGISLIVVNSKRFREFIKKSVLRKYSSIWKGFSKNLKNYQKEYKVYLGYNTLVTLIKTIFEALLFFLLFLSFGQYVDPIKVFFVFSLLSIIILLAFPIGISGLGVREALGVVIFSMIGVDSAVVFNSLMLRIFLVYIINFGTFIKYHDELNLLKKTKIWKKINF